MTKSHAVYNICLLEQVLTYILIIRMHMSKHMSYVDVGVLDCLQQAILTVHILEFKKL